MRVDLIKTMHVKQELNYKFSSENYAIIKATLTTSKMSQIAEKLERMCDHEGSNINHYEK